MNGRAASLCGTFYALYIKEMESVAYDVFLVLILTYVSMYAGV